MEPPLSASILDQDDAALLRALAEGDRSAIGPLYDRHAPMLLALARRLLRRPEEAEELVHDVFVEAWRKAADYDPSRSSVRTWLALRTRSRALDRVRSANNTRVDLRAPERIPEVPVPEGVGIALDSARIRGQLEGLPLKQREVIELTYFDGLSASEVARQLGIPEGTVKSRLSAAVRQLRSALKEVSHATV